MPAIPDWNVPMTLTSIYGNIQFGVQTDRLYLLDPAACQFDITVRSTSDNIPQADGEILHHRFLTGTQIQLAIQLWETDNVRACDELLGDMLDELTKHFRALLNAGDNEGRLAWLPDGNSSPTSLYRMLDDCRLLSYPTFNVQQPLGIVNVTIDSQYPYAQDLTQQSTVIADGGTAVLSNVGSADYWPVLRISSSGGNITAFTVDNGLTQLVYNSALPGAQEVIPANCIEIDMFRNTIFEDINCTGAGNDTNLKAGIDELNSDYWALLVGDNNVSITGADLEVLWAPAWG